MPEGARFVISYCNSDSEFTKEYLTSFDKINNPCDSNDHKKNAGLQISS